MLELRFRDPKIASNFFVEAVIYLIRTKKREKVEETAIRDVPEAWCSSAMMNSGVVEVMDRCARNVCIVSVCIVFNCASGFCISGLDHFSGLGVLKSGLGLWFLVSILIWFLLEYYSIYIYIRFGLVISVGLEVRTETKLKKFGFLNFKP